MPRIEVILFKEDDESVPLVEWLAATGKRPQAKCVAALTRLEELGHELRRPEADYLGDGIYELRVRLQRVNYRMLYSSSGLSFETPALRAPQDEVGESTRGEPSS